MGASIFNVTHHFCEPEWFQYLTPEEREEVEDFPMIDEMLGGQQVVLCRDFLSMHAAPVAVEDDGEFAAFVTRTGAQVIVTAPWVGGDWILDFPPEASDRDVVWAKLRWGGV